MSGLGASMFNQLGKHWAPDIQTGDATRFSEHLGMKIVIDNRKWEQAGPGGKPWRSGSKITCILLKNASGGAITGGLFYTLTVDAAGIGNLHTSDGLATAAGRRQILVDPFLNETVPDGNFFLGITWGVVPVTSGAAIAQGAEIVPTTGGKALTKDADNTPDERAYVQGIMIEAATGADQSKLCLICNPDFAGMS